MVRNRFYFLVALIAVALCLFTALGAAAQAASNGDDINVDSLIREIEALQGFGEGEEPQKEQFPARKPAQLAKVASPATAQELTSYVKGVAALLSSSLSAARRQEVKKAIDACNGNAAALGATAVTTWYNHAYKEALVMAAEASLKAPHDHLLLNNLAALLNLAGGEYKALPILQWLVKEHPRSSMVLNNIGQSYTGVGELEEAMKYFGRCLQEVPNHPEANNTAGEIEASRGNTQKAEMHFEQAANGGITGATFRKLQRLSPSANTFPAYLSRRVRPGVKLPDIFNAYKYQPVRPIRTVDEAQPLMEEHMQFDDFMHNVVDMYAGLVQKEGDAGHSLHERNARLVARDPLAHAGELGRYLSPLAGYAAPLYAALEHSFRLRREDVAEYRRQREEEIYQLQLALGEQVAKNAREDYHQCLLETTCRDCNPEVICNRTVLYPLNNKAANEFLSKAADIREEIQRRELALARETYEVLAYFGYLAGANRHLAKANFYKACHDYAAAILQANETAFVAPAGEEGKALHPKPGGSDTPADMSCPINLKFDWGVAKFELSCDKFKIGAFGGVVKGARHAKTRQSTLQIGAELSKDFEKKIGNEKGVVKVGMEESFFITFDEHGSFVDAGLAFEAKAGATLSTSVETAGKNIPKVDPSIKGEHTILGYQLGVNSGWTFKDGALNGILDSIIGAL